MIKVYLSGGLGNQIFQYASGRSLAIINSTKLVLDLSQLNYAPAGGTKRKYELGNFKIDAEVEQTACWHIFKVLKKFPFLNRLLNKRGVYIESDQGFDSKMLLQPDNTCLLGYWQSPRYFNLIHKQLINELQPIYPLSNKSLEILRGIESSNSVGVHIRRGDYITSKRAENFHGVLPLSYYTAAINIIDNKFDAIRYFIFSDDYDWCEKNINIRNIDITYLNKDIEREDWEDLILMSKCKHQVIANSTFSWWAAWIADNYNEDPNHLVIAPKNWFKKPQEIHPADRFPPHWVLL